MKITFKDYAGELMKDEIEQRELIAKLKTEKYSYLFFSLPHPYYIHLELPWKIFLFLK